MTIEKRTLGRTGFAVSELGLGTWPLAGAGPSNSYGEMSASQAFSVLDAYVSAGGNLIDTARVYNRAETFIGQYLRQSGNRGRLVISSKTVGGSTAANIDQIVTDVEASLRELGTDYLDLYFLHYPAEEPELIEASLEALLRLKEQGKIRAIGASIRGPNVTEETQALCSAYISTGHVDVIQVIYSILRQQNLRAVEEAAARDVGVIVRTALESGLLTGAYAPGHVFAETDHRARYDRQKLDYVLRASEQLRGLAIEPPYEHLAQVATRFALAAPGTSSLIMGAQSAAEVEMNVATLELPPLSERVTEQLHERYGAMTAHANFD